MHPLRRGTKLRRRAAVLLRELRKLTKAAGWKHGESLHCWAGCHAGSHTFYRGDPFTGERLDLWVRTTSPPKCFGRRCVRGTVTLFHSGPDAPNTGHWTPDGYTGDEPSFVRDANGLRAVREYLKEMTSCIS